MLLCAQTARKPPRLVKKSEPEYSEEARKANVSGTVKMEVTVGSDGHVLRVKVIREVGYGLDEKAVEAVRKWEFKPAEEDGQPVVATVPVECTFVLPKK
jgi:protein TonB